MSRGGVRNESVESKAVGLGGNEFETGVLNVAAATTIPAGALLKRDAAGKFALVTDLTADTPVAINPFDIPNKGSAAADMSLRAIIFGRVNANMLNVSGAPVTSPALFDKIRANTLCVPIQTTDISRTE